MKKSREIKFKANEDEITRLKYELKDAIDRRDYNGAAIAKKSLDQHIQIRKELQEASRICTTKEDIERLEQQRLKEEQELRNLMLEKSQKLLKESHYRYQQMKEKHRLEMEMLEKKFNNPLFGSHRFSPNIKSMLKAETYYAQQNNFNVASTLKMQIADKLDQEMDATDLFADKTVQRQVVAAIKKHEKELEGFRAKLEIDKDNLNVQISKSMQRIHNKYAKLRRATLGLHEKDPYERRTFQEEGKNIYKAIDNEFAQAINSSNDLGYHPMKTRESFNSIQFSPREPTSKNVSFQMFSYLNQFGSGPKSTRNPRVQMAISRFLEEERNPNSLHVI